MKAREYCCCAIPVIYAGIYTALLEQLVLGIVAGILAIATPSIVGASTPSFAKWLFAIACWIAAAVQILGFIAVRQERPIFYRRYVTLHSLATVAVFGLGAAWIILSATRHDQAQTKCISDFFGNTVSANNSEGKTLCNIFPWADVGIMGGLWLFFAIVQTYLYIVLSGFGKAQRLDHTRYQSIYDSSKSLNNIPLADRGAWDSRNSTEQLVQPGGHSRHASDASVATVMADNQGYTAPPNAYTQDPTPTPHAGYYSGYEYGNGVGSPPRVQAHPDPDGDGPSSPRHE